MQTLPGRIYNKHNMTMGSVTQHLHHSPNEMIHHDGGSAINPVDPSTISAPIMAGDRISPHHHNHQLHHNNEPLLYQQPSVANFYDVTQQSAATEMLPTQSPHYSAPYTSGGSHVNYNNNSSQQINHNLLNNSAAMQQHFGNQHHQHHHPRIHPGHSGLIAIGDMRPDENANVSGFSGAPMTSVDTPMFDVEMHNSSTFYRQPHMHRMMPPQVPSSAPPHHHHPYVHGLHAAREHPQNHLHHGSHQHHHHHRHQQQSQVRPIAASAPPPSSIPSASNGFYDRPSTSAAAPSSASTAVAAAPQSPTMMSEHSNAMGHMPSNNNSRESRNLAEKNRREKLNGLVQSLTLYVPHVRDSPRRVDKTGVLRYAAHGLRLQYVFGQSQQLHSIDDDMINTVMRLLDSFLIVVNIRGQVVVVSSCIERQLGHCQNDMLGQNIVNYAHPMDRPLVRKALIPDNLDTMFDAVPSASQHCNGADTSESMSREEAIERQLQADRRKFTFRFARAGPRSEPTTYEFVRLEGCFRSADASARGSAHDNPYPAGLQLTRRARTRDDSLPTHINGNDIVFVGTMHIIKPPSLRDRMRDACRFEYKTRHLIDGRIVQCDQRISLVAGYMADEVCGLSPFTFMHKADVRWVMIALRQMYETCDVTGESCYRLISRTGRFIYLRTEGFMEVGQSNYISSFVCRNTLMTDDEGERLIAIMKEQYSMYVNELQMLSPDPEPMMKSIAPSPPSSSVHQQQRMLHAPPVAMSPMDVHYPAQTTPTLTSDGASIDDDEEIQTMVVGIHSMVRGLPQTHLADQAIANHHVRDMPTDEALAEIQARRVEMREPFSYEMPDQREIMLSVQRSIIVIQRSVQQGDSSGDDSGADSGADNSDERQHSGVGGGSSNGGQQQHRGAAYDGASDSGHAASLSGRSSAAVSTSTLDNDHHHHPKQTLPNNVQLTSVCTRQLLGIGARITSEEKTENYRNLPSSSRLRNMSNLTADQYMLLSPQSSSTNGGLLSPVSSCSSSADVGDDPSADNAMGTTESSGHCSDELQMARRAKIIAKSRSPSLVAGRPRDFCSNVGGFRPEARIRLDDQSLRNPRVKRRPQRRLIETTMKRPRALDAGPPAPPPPLATVCGRLAPNGNGADDTGASASKRLAGAAVAAEPIPCGSQTTTTMPSTAAHNPNNSSATTTTTTESRTPNGRTPPQPTTPNVGGHTGLEVRSQNVAASVAIGAPSYEDSLGDHFSEPGSDVSQIMSPSSVGSLGFVEVEVDNDLDGLVIGEDLLLSTINQSSGDNDSQSIVKQDYQVIYLPHSGDTPGCLQIDAHPQSISIDLEDVEDICEMPR